MGESCIFVIVHLHVDVGGRTGVVEAEAGRRRRRRRRRRRAVVGERRRGRNVEVIGDT